MKWALVAMALLAAVWGVFLVIGFNQNTNEQSDSAKVVLIIKSIGTTSRLDVAPIGLSAYEILTTNHNITVTPGGYVRCIDSVCASSSYDWIMYENNRQATEGAKSIIPKSGDTIIFELTGK
ncbi:MAG: DUF4430 domain-containing protein [archaeon]